MNKEQLKYLNSKLSAMFKEENERRNKGVYLELSPLHKDLYLEEIKRVSKALNDLDK